MADQVLSRQPQAEEARLAAWTWSAASGKMVAATVLAAYGLWLAAFFATGHDARDLIDIGRNFVKQGHSSQVIRDDPSYHYPADATGYDGQFVYFIALDPMHARDYIDSPAAYRYGRILEPVLAGALSLGNPALVPYTILLLSWLAIGLSSGVLAAWLKRRGLNPWLALIYSFYAGVVIALRFDLTEALSFGLVIGAIYLFDFGGRYRLPLSAALFALAALARETAVLFTVGFAAALALHYLRDRRQLTLAGIAGFLAIGLLPLIGWHAFLWSWLGNAGLPPRPVVQPVPFLALAHAWPWRVVTLEEIVVVALPALLCGGLALRALRRGVSDAYVLVLLVQVLLLVVFVDPFAFPDLTASARYTIGIVIAALCALPVFDRLTEGRRGWLALCGAAWVVLTPLYLLKPLLG